MKKLIALSLAAIVILVSGPAAGCGFILKGSGNIETKEYNFADFNKVEISSAFEFEISQSGTYHISVTADDNVIEKVRVTKAGDTLKIDMATIPRFGSITLKAVITMPNLYGMDVSGAAHGNISGFSSPDNLAVQVSGASKVSGDITAGSADFMVSGASIVRLQGKAGDITVNVSGASIFDLGDLTADNAKVILSGASLGTINLSGRLDTDLSGASKLSYIGEPGMGTINISGASTLSKK